MVVGVLLSVHSLLELVKFLLEVVHLGLQRLEVPGGLVRLLFGLLDPPPAHLQDVVFLQPKVFLDGVFKAGHWVSKLPDHRVLNRTDAEVLVPAVR